MYTHHDHGKRCHPKSPSIESDEQLHWEWRPRSFFGRPQIACRGASGVYVGGLWHTRYPMRGFRWAHSLTRDPMQGGLGGQGIIGEGRGR
ncbi:hypothetical protein FA13DRAFT_1729570 [Coprinellus micaceus]|uniref:Uncharacterized protein n=1 Tax=Coprinellus micaceus TaxID=71717 RepID=A0A4Y7TJH4_COPMI|nr:hypothetical protein FA13DRAFT_1729570 [Coprinellus micaceus]